MNATAQHEALYQLISGLSNEAAEQAIDYVEYLSSREAEEDIDDMAYIEAHKDEESIPLEEALQGLGL